MTFEQKSTDINVSVIIINFNTFDLTCQCIKSIINNTIRANYEIVLIDNNSDECDANLFIQRFPNIILIKNKENVGFGIANNQGMSIAKGRYFLLLNSDTYLLNNAIDYAVDFAKRETEYMIFGAQILNTDLSIQISHYSSYNHNLFKAFRSGFINENPCLKRLFNKPAQKGEIGGLYGSYIFLHREVFKTTGGFDPDFFMYCEDTEWFRNRIFNKYKIAICEQALIVHIGSQSDKDCRIVNKQNMLSYYLYWYKFGKLHFLIYFIGSYINTVISYFLLPFMGIHERKRHFMIIRHRISLMKPIMFNILPYSNKYGSRNYSLKV